MLQRIRHDNGVELLQSPLLRDCEVTHAFSTRVGGVSPAALRHAQPRLACEIHRGGRRPRRQHQRGGKLPPLPRGDRSDEEDSHGVETGPRPHGVATANRSGSARRCARGRRDRQRRSAAAARHSDRRLPAGALRHPGRRARRRGSTRGGAASWRVCCPPPSRRSANKAGRSRGTSSPPSVRASGAKRTRSGRRSPTPSTKRASSRPFDSTSALGRTSTSAPPRSCSSPTRGSPPIASTRAKHAHSVKASGFFSYRRDGKRSGRHASVISPRG